jgi:hypothetical protein
MPPCTLPKSPSEVRFYPRALIGVHYDRECSVLDVHVNDFYAWLLEHFSPRAVENQAFTAQIKEFYEHSMGICGSTRFFCDI